MQRPAIANTKGVVATIAVLLLLLVLQLASFTSAQRISATSSSSHNSKGHSHHHNKHHHEFFKLKTPLKAPQPNGVPIVLANDNVRFEFSDASAGFGLTSIKNIKSGQYEYLRNMSEGFYISATLFNAEYVDKGGFEYVC